MSRSLWLAAALCLLTSALPAQSVRDGDSALAKFDLDGATALYRKAHTDSPQDYEATWKLARALADKATLTTKRDDQKKFCVEAEQLARSAVRLNAKDSKGHLYLAIAVGKLALFEGGKRKVELSKEVKSEAEAALKLNDKEDAACHVLGIWNREMAELNWMLRKFAEFLYGEFPPASLAEAGAKLRRATELAPNVVAHHVELGLTLITAGKKKAAREQLEKALALPKAWVTDDYYKDIAKRNYRRTTGT
jgi:hypothetical protein